MTSMDATAQPVTAADFLDQAAERLDALCRMPLTVAEHVLWRVAAQQQAALREIAAHIQPRDPNGAHS